MLRNFWLNRKVIDSSGMVINRIVLSVLFVLVVAVVVDIGSSAQVCMFIMG